MQERDAMLHRLTVLALAVAFLAGCSGGTGPDGTTRLVRCDDGGSGGVIIDGVCL
jgi:hypothetical protein